MTDIDNQYRYSHNDATNEVASSYCLPVPLPSLHDLGPANHIILPRLNRFYSGYNLLLLGDYFMLRSTMSRYMVFVYGTLKRNEPNHYLLTEKNNGNAQFVGLANTKEKYPLVIASRYNIPYTLALPGTGENIEGEIYEVDEPMLVQLDKLEDHPKYYERKIRKVILQDSKEELDVWIYLLHQYKSHMLELPYLKTYHNGTLGLNYAARWERSSPGSEYWSDVKEMDIVEK